MNDATRTFVARARGPSNSRRSPKRSSECATGSWRAGWSTCRSAADSSSGSTMATHSGPRRHMHIARWRSEPGSARTSRYEDIENQEYYAVELPPELAESLGARFPSVTTLVADCQQRLPFDDGFFERVLAIHVLEHLPDLPAALDEVARVLAPDGRFVAVIPCEGGTRRTPSRGAYLEAALRARVRSRLRLVHSLRAHQPALGDRGRDREAVPRRGDALLPASDPVRPAQPDHRAHDASALLRLSPQESPRSAGTMRRSV